MIRLHRSFDAATSLADFHGFHGKEDMKVEALEKRLMQEIGMKVPDTAWVFSQVQKHEFEGLLFSDVEAFKAIDRATGPAIRTLAPVRQQFATPKISTTTRKARLASGSRSRHLDA